MKRRLFGHEREIQSWRAVTLTTHRVIHLEARHGFNGSTSIPLEHLQWTRISRSHRPVLIVLAALLLGACLLALGQGASEPGAFLLVMAGMVALVYLGTRQAVLTLASGGGRIELPIDSSTNGRQQAREFLDVIEDAAGRASQRAQLSTAA